MHATKLQTASDDERRAKSEFSTAKTTRDRLQAQASDRDKLQSGYRNALAMMQQFGVAGTPGELRSALAEKQAAAEEHARQRESAKAVLIAANDSWELARTELASATSFASNTANASVLAEQAIAVGVAKREAAFQQLPVAWTEQAATMSADELAAFDRERAELENSGVAARFRRIEDATLLRSEKEHQLATVRTQLAEIPAKSRVSQAEARNRADTASAHVSAADRARTSARQTAAAVRLRAAEFDRRTAEVATAEVAHRRLSTLDRHLGKDGLQRDIVRDAEAEIVRLADDTARNLSGNDLSLELAPEQDGESALTAVALGIGRFAGGQSRPLESVIIDEGFGSLDRDGLAAAHDELTRLKSCLKRVILVSHQEEFAGRFPVGYRLTPGEHGTTATPFRV
jgi:DNA repair exonuclease SbcCD ATPase subunit